MTPLSAPHAGRSGWLPRRYAGPACAAGVPGRGGDGREGARRLGPSSSGVVDAAEAVTPLPPPLRVASESSAAQVPQHGQSLRIKSLAYSLPRRR